MLTRGKNVVYAQKLQYWYKSHHIHTLSLVVMLFSTLAGFTIMCPMSTGALHAHHRAGEKALTERAVVIHMFRSKRFGALEIVISFDVAHKIDIAHPRIIPTSHDDLVVDLIRVFVHHVEEELPRLGHRKLSEPRL